MSCLRIVVALAALLASVATIAAPSIGGVSGTVSHGSSITISGSSFGTKATAAPVAWKTFEDNSITSGGWSIGFPANFSISASNNRSNSSYYGKAYYGGSEERVWFSRNLPSATLFFTSFWLRLSSNANQQSGKFYRVYFSGANSDNIYLSTGDGNFQIRGYSECNGSTEWGAGPSMAQDGWSKVDILLSQSGGMTAWVNGVQSWTHPEWTGGSCGWAPSGHSIDLPNMLDGPERGHVALGEYGYDDILFDTTQARVELCPGATWSARGGCESQPATSWGASSIAVTVNRGGFATGNTAYLYVVDSTGSANASGYSVTLGGGGGGTTYTVTPSAGANGSISPSTPQTVASGGTIGFTVTPNGGYTASVGGTCGGALVGTTYTTNAITANCTVTASFAAETTPPVISAPLPSGVKPYGTASVTLQVTTDENATCRYHATDVAYASMANTFASTGGTTHQQTGFTTSPGQSYTRYVRCIDALGNADTTSTAIAFSVSGTNDTIVDDDDANASQSGQWAASTFYPGYYGAGYEYSPNATGHWYQWTTPLVAGTYQVFARWPAVTGRPNDVSYQITHAGGTTTITNIDQAANGNQWNLLGTYTFGTTGTVRVLSGSTGQEGTAADAVRFLAAGGVPPVLSGLSPTANLPRTATTATLQVTTDLTATCRYMLGSGTPYSGMTPFTNTVSTTHSSLVPVVAGGVYRYCFRCQAGGGETSNESCIRFAVDPTPKKRVRH